MAYDILLKRIYESPNVTDGKRILVDRLWPRGIKKDTAKLDEWAKEITPSTELRQLLHRGEMPFEGFSQGYIEELEKGSAATDFADKCRLWLKEGNVTLLYAAKNEEENHAVVLRVWLRRKLGLRDI